MVVMLSMLASVALGQDILQQEDESFLLQAGRIVKVGVGDHNKRADPVDVCKDSDGVSIKQLDSRMKEDCTTKDFHIWHSNIKRAPEYKPGEYAQDDAWRTVKVQDADGWQSSCVAFVQTNKTSCTDWCGAHGLHCVKAMDDAAGRQANLRTWFEAEDYVVSQCSLGEHWEAGKIEDISGYVSTHGCDLPLNSQICACDPTTTTTTAANPPMLDEYGCTTAVNFVPGKYSQISLTDYCPHCFANPKYKEPMGKKYDSDSTAHVEALAKALDYCKEECNNRNCSAFFFQKHGNGHEICGFYMEAVDLNLAVKHGHQECSQVCTRQKYLLGEHKTRTRRPTCPQNSSPVTSANTCSQSAASLTQSAASLDVNLDFRGSISRPNFAPGCYHLDAPDHPLSSGIFFNDAGGDWHANTGFRGAVALVCSMDNFMTYELGASRTKPAKETAPTCPTHTAPLSSLKRCEEYAKMAGKTFSTANLPNYPPGCSDRIAHPRFAGVLWNAAEGGTWDKHQGFTGEVALVCEPSLDAAAGLVNMNSKCHYSEDGTSDERQFRLEGQATLEDCKARCLETSGCKFYSWTGDGEFAQVCMGCSDMKKFSEHQGFSLHALHQADLDSVAGGLVRMNSKCHYSEDGISDERQFRLEGQATLEDCKARCLETSGCKFFSWTGTGEYAHVCMGCSDVKKFSEHQGFSLHALHRADLDSVSPVA